MLASLNRQEANKRNLHTGKRSESIPSGVAHIETGAVSSHADQNERVHGQKTGDEGVTTPRRHHVSVEEGAKSTPKHGAKLEGLDPEVEGENKKENSDGFVVVTASDRSRNVTGGDTHESRSQKTSRWRSGHFIGKEVGSERRQSRKGRGEENANVSNIDGDRQGAEGVVDDARRDHETGVQSTTSDTAKGMPCSVVEPVPELVESIGDEILCSAEVKPGVDCGMLVTGSQSNR